MDAIVQAAATALVQAISTDAWRQAKEAVTALWRRDHPDHADQLGADLNELRAQVLVARADGDPRAEQILEKEWQIRLQELLRADPALTADLRQALDQVLAPAAAGAVVMTGTSRGSSTFTQIGSQVNYGRP